MKRRIDSFSVFLKLCNFIFIFCMTLTASKIDRYFVPLNLTTNLRPVLFDNETELVIVSKATVCFNESVAYCNGTLTLTSHRLLYICTEKVRSISSACSLGLIKSADFKSGGLFSSPKVILHLNPSSYSSSSSSSSSTSSSASLQLYFGKKELEVFYSKLQTALDAAAWKEREKPESALSTRQEFSANSAGIQGIMRNVQKAQIQTDKTLDTSLTDLNALMKHAHELVELAAKFSQSKEFTELNFGVQDTKEKKEQSKNKEEFSFFLQNMGIPSPVTKESAGSSYHIQLSRQLADFLKKPLDLAGGMMTVTDIYCIFNRARGTELISPNDLLHACELFSSFTTDLKLRKFSSGVMVIQSSSHSDEQAGKQLAKLAHDHSYLTELRASQLLKISLVLAKQRLLTAESMTYLCRDESVEGTRFFENLFLRRAESSS
eukprot:TRINITY_DN1938_c0_g1_i1.p1 TRINITY_DN1938_c0_g1~~TRINITY_DN1938_c0_g1_i1.p1  ORF type:complete len:434 (-),score=79.44 TRINITY_DN1938_c0_g1_i1:36-1337(-)